MNHRPTRRGCDKHRREGFQPTCGDCRRMMAREEKAVEDNKERQARVKAAIESGRIIEEEKPDNCSAWIGLGIALAAIALGAAGSCFSHPGP